METKETVNQEQTTEKTSEKSFTQSEVDAIVSDRLKRERSKYEGYEELKAKAEKFDAIEEASKTELQKATERAEKLEAELNSMKKTDSIRTIREKVSQETGVPSNLLSAEDEETCKAQAEAIMAFATKNGSYPQVKDGGEVTNTIKRSTRQQFAEWWEKQN